MAQEDELTAEFAWQQKVFSRREAAVYAQADDDAPMLERKYREQLRADGVTNGHTLFTYVHSDEFNSQHETLRTVSTSTGERMQHLVRRLLGKTANPTMVCATLHLPQLPRRCCIERNDAAALWCPVSRLSARRTYEVYSRG